jgi:ferredoxin
LKKGIAFSKIHARIKVHCYGNAQQQTYGGKIMAYKITDACVKCGACADNCPVEAISEGDEKFVIDADVCVSCGACAENCPVEAIEEE